MAPKQELKNYNTITPIEDDTAPERKPKKWSRKAIIAIIVLLLALALVVLVLTAYFLIPDQNNKSDFPEKDGETTNVIPTTNPDLPEKDGGATSVIPTTNPDLPEKDGEATSVIPTTNPDSLVLVKDVCTIYPCFNGGTCSMNQQQPSCVCPNGYSGDYCEQIHYCVNHSCLHGGTCIEDSCQARCECLPGYLGNNCEQMIVWPAGSYGLPRTESGCPQAANVTWLTGWRKHMQDPQNMDNSWTIPNHFVPNYSKKYMEQHFCIKTTGGEGNWPEGNYCIFKKGSCPEGFSSGSITWDDADDDNIGKLSTLGGTYPDGIFNYDTHIEYCCRGDGASDSTIALPINEPFFLFRFMSDCQQVRGANVTEEYFYWDDEDEDNISKLSGRYPFDDGGAYNHRLHYCYYSQLD